MERDLNGLTSRTRVQENKIRYLQYNIQAQLKKFEKEIPDTNFLESSVCDNVRNQILNFDDEPHLSKTQNNYRRIIIASELFIGVCSIYSHIVDYEFTQTVSDMVQWEKYRQLSKKISYKIHLEAKREKYFAKEAQVKFLKSLEESTVVEEAVCEDTSRLDSGLTAQVLRPMGSKDQLFESMDDAVQGSKPTEGIEQTSQVADVVEHMQGFFEEHMSRPVESTETEFLLRYEKENPVVLSPVDLIETAREKPSAQVINETLALPKENLLREDSISISSDLRNLTEIRAELSMDTLKLQDPISVTSMGDLSLPKTAAEISLGDPEIQEKPDDEINQILQILEEQIYQKDLLEIEQPEHTLELAEKAAENSKRATFDKLSAEEQRIVVPEKAGSDEWSLPNLEHTEKYRKRHRSLIIDETTIIPDYAARALQLNRNINVERIQVYEGPPKVLQAISVNYLMTAPGFKSSPFEDIRSSKLRDLYNRHLETEKRPVEVLQRRTAEKQRELDFSKERANIEITERVGMRSLLEKSDVLTELPPQKSRLEDLDMSVTGVLPKESLTGIPLSRIINSTIEAPGEAYMERINAAPVLPSPRVQQLQGKSLDRKAGSPWFLSTKESPPDAKYREFNYVYKKLQNYWSLFESQGMEKCITLREFFSFEQDRNVANILTFLRVVDKMSIQRKLVLENKNRDVFIRPFESPYVSDKQLLLRGKELIF